MNKGIICLGANCAEKHDSLRQAAEFLESCVRIEARSGTYDSEPEYQEPEAVYLNEVIAFSTELDYEAVYGVLKTYETEERCRHTGDFVWIDIDIVYWNSRCVRPRDAASNYFLKGIRLFQKSSV